MLHSNTRGLPPGMSGFRFESRECLSDTGDAPLRTNATRLRPPATDSNPQAGAGKYGASFEVSRDPFEREPNPLRIAKRLRRWL